MLVHVHQRPGADTWQPWYTEFDEIAPPSRAELAKAERVRARVKLGAAVTEAEVMVIQPGWGWVDG